MLAASRPGFGTRQHELHERRRRTRTERLIGVLRKIVDDVTEQQEQGRKRRERLRVAVEARAEIARPRSRARKGHDSPQSLSRLLTGDGHRLGAPPTDALAAVLWSTSSARSASGRSGMGFDYRAHPAASKNDCSANPLLISPCSFYELFL